jgi:hypothetical protein
MHTNSVLTINNYFILIDANGLGKADNKKLQGG